MHSRLSRWSRYVYLAGIVLALVLVVPAVWAPFQLTKLAVFGLLALASVALFVMGGGGKEMVRTHGLYAALLVGLLPLVYLLSAFASTDPTIGYLGVGVETDTVAFALMGALAFLLSFSFFKTLRMVRLLVSVVFWVAVAAVVFQVVSILFGASVIPFPAFADHSVNLIGKWNDFGILVGLLGMFLLATIELASLTTIKKWVMIAGAVVVAILLGVINFPLVWILVLVYSLVIALIKFVSHRGSESSEHGSGSKNLIKRLPWFSLIGVVVSLAFIFFGTALNGSLTKMFPITSLEVRPSYSSTLQVINDARGDSLGGVLLGTGPNTFNESWLSHKAAEINQTAFWNLDFNVGYSVFVTALGTVGVLGVIAWLMPVLLVLAGLVRAFRMSVLAREDRITATTLALGSLYIWATVLFYVPSQNIILLGFVLSGATFAYLWRQGRSTADQAEGTPTGKGSLLAPVLMIALLVLSLGDAALIGRRLTSESHVQQGLAALSVGSGDIASAEAQKALAIENTSDALRLEINGNTILLQQIAQNTKLTPQDAQKQFADLASSTLLLGKTAFQLSPKDYQIDMSIAGVYNLLAALKIQGAAQNALAAYESAAKKNPTNPTIPLALARLAASQGDLKLTDSYLAQSLKLKTNYTDAILLAVQLYVANNDIGNAIKAATAAAQTAPGVAPIWFQLGLLYYAANDTTDAAKALEQAISIVPEYANAKYFLGLSYYAQKRQADAIAQFESLAASNPSSAEVALILSNMKSGNPPFQGATPPANVPPQKRTTAPLSE